MKVALCTEILYPLYGVERRVYELGMRLPKYGVDVEIYTSTPRKQFRQLDIRQVSHCTITNPPKRNYAFCVGYMFRLFKELMKTDCDIVHAEGHLSLISCSLAASLRKKPSVATIHDLYLADWGKMYKSVASLGGLPFEVISCKMPFTKVLTVNSALKKKMHDTLKISGDKVQVLHSGIDTKYLSSIKSDKRNGSIIYIGRLVPQKNVDLLIRAYSMLPPSLRKSHALKIVGEGSELNRLQSLAKQLGVGVEFTGKVERHDDVVKLLKASSLFVLPSRRESFGITILEAMFSGVPVISTATEGPSDHVNGRNGFLVPVGDAQAMSEKMRLILEDNELSKRLADEGRKTAAAHDWDNIAKNVAKVYKEVYN